MRFLYKIRNLISNIDLFHRLVDLEKK